MTTEAKAKHPQVVRYEFETRLKAGETFSVAPGVTWLRSPLPLKLKRKRQEKTGKTPRLRPRPDQPLVSNGKDTSSRKRLRGMAPLCSFPLEPEPVLQPGPNYYRSSPRGSPHPEAFTQGQSSLIYTEKSRRQTAVHNI